MKYLIITDTHFGHKNMVEYCQRPEDFAEKIISNWSKTISNKDVVIHLGDICIGGDLYWHEKLSELPGKKILVKGNHDSKSDNWYLEHGWDFVCDSFQMTFQGKKVYFSHYPVAWDGYYDLNIHGHFHNSDYRRHEPELVALKNGYQKLIALEYTDYKTVDLKSLI